MSGVSAMEKTTIFNWIRRKLGAGVVKVELKDEQIEAAFCTGIQEYSTYINDWFLRNRLGEMLGLPVEIDFTLKFVSQSLSLESSLYKAIAEQNGLGANSGTREYKTDFIVLTAGTQNYILPADREINEVLWFTPSFINLFGLDPFSNSNIAYTEFGASFAGQTLYHVMPVFDTILTAQAAELRNRVRGSEYSYSIHPSANGTRLLRLYPVPNSNSNNSSVGIAGGVNTPGTVFYKYYDKVGFYGNPDFSGTSANPGFSSSTTIVGNGLVATPADAQLHYIDYSQINDVGRNWIKNFAFAESMMILALIRGKFDKVPIPDAEVVLNADQLMATSDKIKDRLFEKLAKDLEELSYEKLMEKRATIQESVNKVYQYTPMPIFTDGDLG